MNTKFIFPTLFFLMLLFSSCEDTLEPSGIETKVFGRVYDNINNLPITNQKLLISEWNSIPQITPGPNDDFIQFLDSTYTDIDGYYDITFTTSGKGDLYYISYENDDSIWTYYKNPVEIENLGDDNEIDYEFLKLFPVNLLITLEPDVEYLPIQISSLDFTYIPTPELLTETNVQYTKQIFTDKNTDDQLKLFRTKPDGLYQTATYSIPATNTSELAEFEIFITNDDFID